VHCDATPEEWRTEMKLADTIENPDSLVRTFAPFVVEAGKPGAEERLATQPHAPRTRTPPRTNSPARTS
jgi:hypothetical protein